MNPIVFVYILAAVVVRVLPHPWNMTPVGAMFLFSAATFRNRWYGWLAPLSALMISDYFVNQIVWHGKYSWFSPYMWSAFSVVGLLGWTIRKNRTVLKVAGVAISGSLLFWVLSNLSVWVNGHGRLYPISFAGLLACYTAAIPFLGSDVMGNLVYCGIMFGSYAWVKSEALKSETRENLLPATERN